VGFEPSPELFSADDKRMEMEWQGVPDSRCSNAKTAKSEAEFILEMISIDLHCHLEVSRPARSFRHKIDCSAEMVRDIL